MLRYDSKIVLEDMKDIYERKMDWNQLKNAKVLDRKSVV